MPKFTIRLRVINNSGVPVKAHVGASLVGEDWMEYYNTADDVTMVFTNGKNEFTRYLNTVLGKNQKYNLVVAVWEGEKPIGHGVKYATVTLKNAVEKKKKIIVKMTTEVLNFSPTSFTSEY